VRRATIACVAALLACAGSPTTPDAANVPARLRVEMFGGFAASPGPVPADRVVLLVDSTGSMVRDTRSGSSRVRAARAAAERFVANLPGDASPELLVIGNGPGSRCSTAPARTVGRERVLSQVSNLRAGGQGSLVAALEGIAESAAAEDGGFPRVVAITSLDDGCGGDLCGAAQALVQHGVRLDLVLIGDVAAPACLTEVIGIPRDGPPVPWPTQSTAAFHVESRGPDPAILVCGESGGLPVQVPPGNVDIVVKLDPPLRVEHRFQPGTRWVLQVLDFPGLVPTERQWRWHADAVPGATAGSAR
jgi:hypothetical protein